MYKRLLKNIKIIVVCFIIFMIAFSLIVSQDDYHLETCHEEHCVVCSFIRIAQNINRISIVIHIVSTMIGFLIYMFLSRLYEKKSVFIQSSLVFQNVQLNE